MDEMLDLFRPASEGDLRTSSSSPVRQEGNGVEGERPEEEEEEEEEGGLGGSDPCCDNNSSSPPLSPISPNSGASNNSCDDNDIIDGEFPPTAGDNRRQSVLSDISVSSTLFFSATLGFSPDSPINKFSSRVATDRDGSSTPKHLHSRASMSSMMESFISEEVEM